MTIKVDRSGDSSDNFYLGAIFKGMAVTAKNALKTLKNPGERVTDYPEQKRQMPYGYRGLHRLTQREDGSTKCVACMMCATACPAECIHIEAEEVDNPEIEKRPRTFNIDLLECVFCGMCVEACPLDAIRMDTGVYTIAEYERDSFIINKEQLLANQAGQPTNEITHTWKERIGLDIAQGKSGEQEAH